MKRPFALALIYGSARPGRFCDVVARWTQAEIDRHGGFSVDPIDPAAPDFPANDGELRARIGRADAVLIVTPEYNHSYPAPLKALIDSVHAEWAEKPVAFVSYGGVSGGLRAVEHLRHVFAELDAHDLRQTVSFANAWEQFDEEGALREPAKARTGMAKLLTRLSWSAEALKAAREARDLAEAAA